MYPCDLKKLQKHAKPGRFKVEERKPFQHTAIITDNAQLLCVFEASRSSRTTLSPDVSVISRMDHMTSVRALCVKTLIYHLNYSWTLGCGQLVQPQHGFLWSDWESRTNRILYGGLWGGWGGILHFCESTSARFCFIWPNIDLHCKLVHTWTEINCITTTTFS